MRILPGLFIFLFSCGSSEPVEVVSSTLVGTVDGSTLDLVYGVANTLDSGTVSIAAGIGKLNCGSQSSSNPPGSGIYVNIQIPEAVVGVPEQHAFQFLPKKSVAPCMQSRVRSKSFFATKSRPAPISATLGRLGVV